MPLSVDDKLSLLEIEARFDWFIDRGDIDSWVVAWTEDGVFDASYASAYGHAELRSTLVKREEGFSKGKRHTTSNHLIEGDENEARVFGYLVAFEREEVPRVIATGIFTDTFVRRGGAWKVRHRKLVVDRNGQNLG